MGKVIHKFNCNNYGEYHLPAGKVLSVLIQNNQPVVYVERDANNLDDTIVQYGVLVGTGWEFDTVGYEFVGSVIYSNDRLVSHLYVKTL